MDGSEELIIAGRSPESSGARACPECGQQPTQVGTFWICPTHGQLPEPRSFSPLRIFLSYGHDSNEELVLLIKSDLEKRGHDVWIDTAEIRFGDDWRRSITEGIADSERVLAFLSKHSTRDPGVCRDEIAVAVGIKGGNIQTLLVESEEEVAPPVNISHIQWLDMHDWRSRRAGDPDEWQEWYQQKLAEIVLVVESDESRRFVGEIETLSTHLKPIAADSRISHTLSRGFEGRAWLFDAVESWREDQNQDSRLFWIMGDAGVGKSAFAAQLASERSDVVIAAQFCEWDKTDHRDARRVVRSVAFQLATRLPDYRKLLLALPEIADLDAKEPAELFDYLLATPLRTAIHGGRRRYLIVIDAIDESAQGDTNPLVETLARQVQHLPEWLGLVATSRPEYDVKTLLQALNPVQIDTNSESNREDIRTYLQRRLGSFLISRPDVDRLLREIVDRSEGLFLYAERFCHEVEAGHLQLDQPEAFPQGLGGIYYQYFQRLFPDLGDFRTYVRPALRTILSAREALPVKIIQQIFNWEDEEFREFSRSLGSLFVAATEGTEKVVRPYHKSLADWLANEEYSGPYFVSIVEGNRMLASHGWEEYERDVPVMQPYFLRHLVEHLYQAEEYEKILQICQEGRFFPQRWRYPATWVSYDIVASGAKAMVEGFPVDLRGQYSAIVSHSFARTALALKDKSLAFGTPSPEVVSKLLEARDGSFFSEYRDSFYKFLYASTMAAIIAVESNNLQPPNNCFLQDFARRFSAVREWHSYLTSASAAIGLSGMLEDEALELYGAWKFAT